MGHKIYNSKFLINRLETIKSRGIEIKTAIDIGANNGQWCSEFKSVFTNTEVLSIEAQQGCVEQLSKTNPNYKICLMGRENNDEVKFYSTSNIDVGASIYQEATQWGQTSQWTMLPMITLDSLGQQFDWIKMDVQGAEWDIIKGGLATLSNGTFLQLELSVMGYNSGAKLISEVISYLFNVGYVLYDITELMYVEENDDGIHKLAQLDCLFVNDKYSHLLDIQG
jgi:FkbM family methyltransferase